MAERRRHKRTPKRLRVRFGDKDLDKIGFTRDVSRGGMFILCKGPLPVGASQHVQVFIENEGFLLFEATPVHVKQVPAELRAFTDQGFGVRFLLPAEAMAKIVPVTDGPERPQPFELVFATLDALREAWDREIRYGGVFVETLETLARDTTTAVRLRLTFAGETFEVAARVLQVSTGANGARKGLSLEFVDRARIWQILSPYVYGSDAPAAETPAG